MDILKIKNVTKRYGKQIAIDNLSLNIEEGDIFGLIGQNGAGKTTLMRITAGLTSHDGNGGEVSLFGKSKSSELNLARTRMGCVIETPALYPNLTAAQNLEYYRIQRGIPDKTAPSKALELVNLTDTGKKKFKNFSLGMKQRLGLALAILNRPDFVMLDEPVNGLDPTGIIEMRETIRRLNFEGMTILISSHLLSELSQTATKYAVIHHGKLVKTFTQEKLREECQHSIAVTVDDTAKAAIILETVLNIRCYKQVSATTLRIYEYLDNPSEVSFQLVTGGVRVYSIQNVGDSLEDYFTKIIGEVASENKPGRIPG